MNSVRKHFESFEQETTGSMTAEEFDEFVRDTTNFMEYISEPIRSTRRVLGVWVLIYLGFFFIHRADAEEANLEGRHLTGTFFCRRNAEDNKNNKLINRIPEGSPIWQ